MPDPLLPLAALPGADVATDRVRSAMDSMLAHRVLRRRGEQVAGESVLRGAWAAAVGAGSPLTLEDVRAGRVEDPFVQGALRVYGDLIGLASTWRSAPLQALARVHLLAAADLVDAASLGRPADPSGRLATLAEVVTTTRVAAPVVAAVVRGELLALDAFAPVTPVVADAAVRLVIITAGLDPSSRSVPEVGARELADREPAALAAYRTGTSEGLADWTDHVSQILVLGARETVAICEALQR